MSSYERRKKRLEDLKKLFRYEHTESGSSSNTTIVPGSSEETLAEDEETSERTRESEENILDDLYGTFHDLIK
ncbi:unnamed protein product [Brachionus calyciflorus]|uniref:Uncharacterized protein n=1 Tax=Brachionus calyciflorus TaxID=104777 RepID=A0A813MBB4_9BILA|nr:unnamed protein product [Brachionus calyciflorus]